MSDIIHLTIKGGRAAVLITVLRKKQQLSVEATFENGYQNVFYVDVQSGEWVEEDLGFTQLAKIIGESVGSMNLKTVHIPKQLTWHHFCYKKGKKTIGFFGYLDGDKKLFDVFDGNYKFMFTLQSITEDEWMFLSNSNVNMDEIDSLILQEIITVLPMYI